MKKSLLAAAVVASFAGAAAAAESSITLYGIVDVGIRHQTNAASNGDSITTMNPGTLSTSRWGLRGNEDLGGGMNAIFTMEAGFNVDDGTQNGSTRAFHRQSFLGMNGTWGQLTFGRQYNTLFDTSAKFDPLGYATFGHNNNGTGALQNATTAAATTLPVDGVANSTYTDGWRNDNLVKYTGTWEKFSVGAGYSFGEVAGDSKQNSRYALSGSYNESNFAVGVALGKAQSNANPSVASKFTLVGGSFKFDPVTIKAIYQARTVEANGTTTPESKDRVFGLGATYQANPKLALTLAAYNNKYTDGSTSQKNAGRNSWVALADYSISKRTDFYFVVDRTKWTLADDGATAQFMPAGMDKNKSATGLTVGVRHRF